VKRLRRGSLSHDAAAAVAALASLTSACRGSEGRPAERPRPSLVSEVSSLPAFVTPAEWRYHPPEPARVNAQLELPSGDRVLAGRRGERWLVAKGTQELEAASVLAPEDLVGISQTASGSFIFVGKSGVSYEAHTPMAAFFRSSAPLEPLTSVTSSGSAIVGIRRDRGLLRSEDGGATWKAVGPSGPQFVSVVLGEGGRGLALAVPEALYETRDGGQTFAALAARSVGAFSLERLADRDLGVVSALGLFRYREGAADPLEPTTGVEAQKSELKSPRGPSALALNEGRAVATGGTYYELSPREKGGWQLLSGPLSGGLAARDVPELSACKAVRLAAFERNVHAACFRLGVEAATQPIELWASVDAGRSFHREKQGVDGSLGSFRSALGSDGTLLLGGVCPVYGAGSGCAPQGIARRSRARPQSGALQKQPAPGFELSAAATPSLAETPLSLAFSLDGRTAYAVGRRTKGGVLGIFVSKDGGRSFEAEDVSLPTGEGSEDDERWESNASGVRVDALVPAEDGTIGLSVARYRSRVWLVFDENGRLLSVARPPDARALLGVAGSRALAVAPATNDVWESLDGGATFQKLGRLPIDLCAGDSNCDAHLSCTSFGCAIGNDLSRLGWGGQNEDDSWLQPAIAQAPVDYSVPRLKTPIACTLDSSPWQALDGVTEFPTAFQAAIGKSAWFASGFDGARAGAWVYVASANKARVDKEMLLSPSERGRSYALEVSDQVEGVAALRYQTPDTNGSGRLTGVEIAWLNLFEGRTRRASLADGGAYAPGDFSRAPRGGQDADPALFSIAEGGLYLRIHHAPADNQPTLFFDGQKVQAVPPVAWPTLAIRGTHSEMAHVEGEHVPLLLVGRGSAVVRAQLKDGKQELEAFANGALDPARFGLTQSSNIAYAGSRAGQVIETFDSATARAEAQLFLFRARGAVLERPIPVPTQLSISDRVERCAASVEASTPRVVAAPYPGTRHPVIVSDGGDAPQAFLTGYAVMHGTPGAPCVSAFDAEPVAPDGVAVPSTRVILPFGDLARAYVFRASSQQGPMPRVEYHLMSCKLDPSAEVPPELYRAPGALVPRVR
jgi:hypothetical protein